MPFLKCKSLGYVAMDIGKYAMLHFSYKSISNMPYRYECGKLQGLCFTDLEDIYILVSYNDYNIKHIKRLCYKYYIQRDMSYLH